MATKMTRRRFTADEYHRMAEVGLLTEDDRVELIQGEIVQMAPIGARHANGVRHLNVVLSQRFIGRAIIDVQNPVRLGHSSEPQPDLALLRQRSGLYPMAHPGPEDVLLVIEVADTTEAYDRQVKLPLYAHHGISEAWLVDLAGRRVEVYRAPRPDGYSEIRILQAGDHIAPQAFPDALLSVDEILGL